MTKSVYIGIISDSIMAWTSYIEKFHLELATSEIVGDKDKFYDYNWKLTKVKNRLHSLKTDLDELVLAAQEYEE